MRCSGLSLTTRSIRRASILSGTAAAAMPRETPHHPTKTGYLCIYTILVLVEQNKKQIFLAAAGGRSGRRIPGAPMYPGGGWNRICWGQARKKRGRKRWVLAPAGTNERRKEGTTVCSRMWEYLGLFSLSHTHSPLSLLFPCSFWGFWIGVVWPGLPLSLFLSLSSGGREEGMEWNHLLLSF